MDNVLWAYTETSKKSGGKKGIMQSLIKTEHLKHSASQETKWCSICMQTEGTLFLPKHSQAKADKESRFIEKAWDSTLMGSQKVALSYQTLHCGCQMWAIKLNLLWQGSKMKVLAFAGKKSPFLAFLVHSSFLALPT